MVFCIGELIIDFVSLDKTKKLEEVGTFMKVPGGASANVAVTISRLNGEACFLGKVGDDAFGNYLENVLLENNINSKYVTKGGKTTLAFITLDENGERDFQFNRGSDGNYELTVGRDDINSTDIVHFGSATAFISEELRESYFKLLDYAVEKEAFISFDPNYRSALVKDENMDGFYKDSWHFMKKANCIKLSLEEALILTNSDSLEGAIERILEERLEVVFITLGSKGTLLFKNDQFAQIQTIEVNQKDSTGAGDAFVGGILYKISIIEDRDLNMEEWKEIVTFGNKVGALTCEKYGAIPAIPTKEEVDSYS